MPDARFQMPDAGCQIPDAGYRMPDNGCRMPDVIKSVTCLFKIRLPEQIMEIQSLENIEFDDLYLAFAKAFRDYEMQIDKLGLRSMLERRGFDPGLSFGAFEDEKLVAFTFNGIGEYNGLKTAYDTGTGTIKEYRGQGLAGRVFTHSIPYLTEAGISQYLLEVLQHNDAAVSVYRKQGFEVTREFNYFIQDIEKVRISDLPADSSLSIRQVDLSYRGQMIGFRDFEPSWQNSFDAIGRNPGNFIMLGAFSQDVFSGYAILEPGSGDITQVAVEPGHRRKGLGSRLVAEVLKYNKAKVVKVINTEVSCEAITHFLAYLGISLKGKQYEMVKRL